MVTYATGVSEINSLRVAIKVKTSGKNGQARS